MIVLATILWFGDGLASQAYSPRRKCTAAASKFDPLCARSKGSSVAVVRHLCDYFWVAEVCSLFQPDKPQYVSHVDPSPGNPLVQRVGALHNHSGYSDGDPYTIPADYFRAGRTGHNQADAGGDSGVIIDFMMGSEHSDNEKIPITTNAEPASSPTPGPLACAHLFDNDHYWKWTGDAAPGDRGNRVLPRPRLHRLHRHAGLRVHERLLQPHQRLLLPERRST